MKDEVLQLTDYAGDIDLDKLYIPAQYGEESKNHLVDSLLLELGEENSKGLNFEAKRRQLHARINTIEPNKLSKEGVKRLDQLLQFELSGKRITDSGILAKESKLIVGNTRISVWQGDITTLKVDAIVNAANSRMLGCFEPLHACIDNAIHSAAGVQLRDDCDVIMKKQGFDEPTGTAKITRAYNLPSKYVLHTVGPIVRAQVSSQNTKDLSASYTSCLDICRKVKAIRSVAFCGISTGVFGYPADKAAEQALITVSSWLDKNPNTLDLLVFDVFSDKDRTIYEALLQG